MIVFESTLGEVIRLQDPGVLASVRFAVVDPIIEFRAYKSIITRISYSPKGNAQFSHMLGNNIYIYAFGDRVGQMGISGLSFAHDCDGLNARHGIEYMIHWYCRNRVAVRDSTVRVMIGTTAIDGFVLGATFDVVDPSILLVQWNLDLIVLPCEDEHPDIDVELLNLLQTPTPSQLFNPLEVPASIVLFNPIQTSLPPPVPKISEFPITPVIDEFGAFILDLLNGVLG